MPNNSWRNGLALGLVAGSSACAILISTISIIPQYGTSSTTDWLSSISSILSVVISVIAVLLVSATLKTTQDTLEATRKIGLNQTRAWVLVKNVEVKKNQQEDNIHIRVIFSNYGLSPATNFLSEVYIYNEPYPFDLARPLEKLTSDYAISNLAPGVIFYREITEWIVRNSDNYRTRIRIRFSYNILDGTIVDDFSEWVVINDNKAFHVRPSMPVDHKRYDAAYAD